MPIFFSNTSALNDILNNNNKNTYILLKYNRQEMVTYSKVLVLRVQVEIRKLIKGERYYDNYGV